MKLMPEEDERKKAHRQQDILYYTKGDTRIGLPRTLQLHGTFYITCRLINNNSDNNKVVN